METPELPNATLAIHAAIKAAQQLPARLITEHHIDEAIVQMLVSLADLFCPPEPRTIYLDDVSYRLNASIKALGERMVVGNRVLMKAMPSELRLRRNDDGTLMASLRMGLTTTTVGPHLKLISKDYVIDRVI